MIASVHAKSCFVDGGELKFPLGNRCTPSSEPSISRRETFKFTGTGVSRFPFSTLAGTFFNSPSESLVPKVVPAGNLPVRGRYWFLPPLGGTREPVSRFSVSQYVIGVKTMPSLKLSKPRPCCTSGCVLRAGHLGLHRAADGSEVQP